MRGRFEPDGWTVGQAIAFKIHFLHRRHCLVALKALIDLRLDAAQQGDILLRIQAVTARRVRAEGCGKP